MFVLTEVDACALNCGHNCQSSGSGNEKAFSRQRFPVYMLQVQHCTWSCIEEIFLKPTGQMMAHNSTGSYMMCKCAAIFICTQCSCKLSSSLCALPVSMGVCWWLLHLVEVVEYSALMLSSAQHHAYSPWKLTVASVNSMLPRTGHSTTTALVLAN